MRNVLKTLIPCSHRVDRVLGFFSSRPHWDPPPPTRRRVCPLPSLLGSGVGKTHSLGGDGVGGPISDEVLCACSVFGDKDDNLVLRRSSFWLKTSFKTPSLDLWRDRDTSFFYPESWNLFFAPNLLYLKHDSTICVNIVISELKHDSADCKLFYIRTSM